MKTLELARATSSLASYARRVKGDPVVLTRRGKPVAALIEIKDADLETLTVSTHPEFIAIIEESRRRLKAEGGISSSEMRRRLGIKRTARAIPAGRKRRKGSQHLARAER